MADDPKVTKEAAAEQLAALNEQVGREQAARLANEQAKLLQRAKIKQAAINRDMAGVQDALSNEEFLGKTLESAPSEGTNLRGVGVDPLTGDTVFAQEPVEVDGVRFDPQPIRVGLETLPSGSLPTQPLSGSERANIFTDEERSRRLKKQEEDWLRVQSQRESLGKTEVEAQEAYLLGLKYDTDPLFFLENLDQFKDEETWTQKDFKDLADNYPALTQMILEGPVQAKALVQKRKPLSFWEEYVDGRWITDPMNPQFRKRTNQPLIDRMFGSGGGFGGNLMASGATVLGWTGSEYWQERAKELSKAAEPIPNLDPDSAFEMYATQVVGAAGFIGVNAAAIALGSKIGAGIGGAITLNPVGAAIGAGVGAFVTDVVANIFMSAPDIHNRLVDLGVEKGAAKTLAIGAAGIGGVIGRLGIGKMMRVGARETAEKLGIKWAQKVYKEGPPSRWASFAKGWAEAETHAAATMAGQATITALAIELGRLQSSGEQLSWDSVERVATEVMDATTSAMVHFAPLMLVPGARKTFQDQKDYVEALANLDSLGKVFKSWDELPKEERLQLMQDKPLLKKLSGLATQSGFMVRRMEGVRGPDEPTFTLPPRRFLHPQSVISEDVVIPIEAVDRILKSKGIEGQYEKLIRESAPRGLSETELIDFVDENLTELRATGYLDVNLGDFVDYIHADKSRADILRELRWNNTKSVAEMDAESAILMGLAARQFVVPRRINESLEAPPALAVMRDIEWGLQRSAGDYPAVAKAIAEVFANFFATQSAKIGKLDDPDWDAYGLWAKNPLWMRWAPVNPDAFARAAERESVAGMAKSPYYALNPYRRSLVSFKGDSEKVEPKKKGEKKGKGSFREYPPEKYDELLNSVAPLAYDRGREITPATTVKSQAPLFHLVVNQNVYDQAIETNPSVAEVRRATSTEALGPIIGAWGNEDGVLVTHNKYYLQRITNRDELSLLSPKFTPPIERPPPGSNSPTAKTLTEVQSAGEPIPEVARGMIRYHGKDWMKSEIIPLKELVETPWEVLKQKYTLTDRSSILVAPRMWINGKSFDSPIRPEERGVTTDVPEGHPRRGMPEDNDVSAPVAPQWMTVRELQALVRSERARSAVPILPDFAGGMMWAAVGDPARGGRAKDGTAFYHDFMITPGHQPLRGAMGQFHELVHYAQAVQSNVIASLGESATGTRIGDDYLQIKKWSGFRITDANGKMLTPYQLSQLEMFVHRFWQEGMNYEAPPGIPTGLSQTWSALANNREVMRRVREAVPNAPVDGFTPVDFVNLRLALLAADERVAYAFTSFIRNGKAPVPWLNEPFRRIAFYSQEGLAGNRWGSESSIVEEMHHYWNEYVNRLSPVARPESAGGRPHMELPTEAFGGPGDVPTLFRRFFAADGAIVSALDKEGVTTSLMTKDTAGRPRGTPSPSGTRVEAEPQPAASGFGEGLSAGDWPGRPLMAPAVVGGGGAAGGGGGGKKPPKPKPKPEHGSQDFPPERIKLIGEMVPDEARAEARAALIKKLKEAEDLIITAGQARLTGKRKLTYEVARERDAMREKVEEDVRNNPVARAMVAVGGRRSHLDPDTQATIKKIEDMDVQFRLDYRAVKAEYGAQVAESIPSYMYARGRVDRIKATSLSDMAGVFKIDPEEFLNGVVRLRSFKNFIEQQTQVKMIERYGELLTNPEALAEEALKQILSDDKAVEHTIGQMRVLAEAIGDEAFNARVMNISPQTFREEARKWANSETRQVYQLSPEQIARAEKFNMERAFQFAADGNLRKAFEHYEKRLWLHTLFLAVEEKRSQVDAIRKDLEGRMTRPAYREKLGKASPLLREAHDGLLEAMGLRDVPPGEVPMEPRLIANLKDIETYAKQKSAVLAFSSDEVVDMMTDLAIRVGPKLGKVNKLGQSVDWKKWSYLTIPQAELVQRVVMQLNHLAKEENAYRKQGELMEIRDMTEIVNKEIQAKNLPELKSGWYKLADSTSPKSLAHRLSFQSLDGQLTEASTMLGFMSETLRDSVMSEFREARGRRDRYAALIHSWWDENWMKQMSKHEVRRRMKERIDLKKYDMDIKPLPGRDKVEPIDQTFDRAQAMMVALHMGNPENEWRLLQGYGWKKEDVLRMLGENLTRDELLFVQSTWDFFNKQLWPLVKEKTERQTGLPLKFVSAAPLDVPLADGTTVNLKGGYFPAKYNRDLATRSQTLHATDDDIGYFYKSNYARQTPYTYKGHTKERTPGYSDRLALDMGILSSHLVQVVHDLAFDDFIRNTGRLFQDKDFSDTMVRYMGTERVLALKDWLWGVANGYVDTIPESQRRWYKNWQGLKDTMVLSVLGHNVGVALGDLTNVFVAMAAGRVSPTQLGLVMKDLASRPADLDTMYEDLKAKSTVVNTRSQHWILELHKRMQDPLRQTTMLEQVFPSMTDSKLGDAHARMVEGIKETAFYLQEKIDKYSTILIWNSAYKSAEHLAEEARVQYADRMLEESLPHLEKMSQPAFLSKPGVFSSIMLFHGYFNKLGNILRQDFHEKVYEPYQAMKAGKISKGQVAWSAAKYAAEMAAIFFLSNVVAEWLSGRGKDKNEDIGQYLVRKMVSAPFGVVPYGAAIGEGIGLQASKAAGALWDSAKPGMSPTRGEYFSFRQIPQFALIESIGRAGLQAFNKKRGWDKRTFDALEAYLIFNGLPARQWRRTSQYLFQTLVTGDRNVNSIPQFLSGTVYGERDNQPSNVITDTPKIVDWMTNQ